MKLKVGKVFAIIFRENANSKLILENYLKVMIQDLNPEWHLLDAQTPMKKEMQGPKKVKQGHYQHHVRWKKQRQ